MKNSILILSLAIISLLTFDTVNAATTVSSTHDWIRLGSKKVNFKLDRDVIHVGARDGRFSKLKVQVTGGAINMRKMVVEYKNGQKEIIELRHHFSARSGSRIIDLNGNRRFIKDVTFIYDSVNKAGRKATVHVFGKH